MKNQDVWHGMTLLSFLVAEQPREAYASFRNTKKTNS